MTGFTIEIDTREAAALALAWAKGPDIVIEEHKRAATESTLLLERETREGTPVGVGGGASGLRGSIAARLPEVVGDAVIGVVGTSLHYAQPVELGSKPHFPPIEPLALWARIKLGVPEEEARGVAFAIAKTIAKRGAKGVFMFRHALETTQADIARIFARARGRIARRLASFEGGR